MAKYHLFLLSFLQKGLEAKSYIHRISGPVGRRGPSFPGDDVSGQREWGLLPDHPRMTIHEESPFLYVIPVSTASSLPLPLNVPNLQVVQVFFFFPIPFLSFLIFSHSPWQLPGGGGRADGSSCLHVWDLCSLSL